MDGQDVMTLMVMNKETYQEVVRTAAAQLVSVEHDRNGTYVKTPLQYADGSYVVVRVDHGGGQFFVSDFGAGLEVARMMGGASAYKRAARSVSEASGVGFDSSAFFVLTVAAEQLPGAIAAVANCSQEAVNVTAMRMSEKSAHDQGEVLFDRLSSIFGRKFIAKDAQITGASNTPWHVASLVTIESRQVAFESVSKHPISIVHTTAKFGDIARLDNAPGRVSVVDKKIALGTYLSVLSYNSSVIERSAGDQVYQKILGQAA